MTDTTRPERLTDDEVTDLLKDNAHQRGDAYATADDVYKLAVELRELRNLVVGYRDTYERVTNQRDAANAEVERMRAKLVEAKRIGLSVCRRAHELVTIAGTGEYGSINEAWARLKDVQDVRDLASLLRDSEERARNSERACEQLQRELAEAKK